MHLFVAHTMDIGESKGKGRGKGKSSNLAAGRAKPINWPLALSEFLLDWYIEKKLQLPPKAVIKKIHHTACTLAINSKYGTTYTVDQVQHHYRRHKENWSLVARHLNESGNGWDETTKMLTLSQATLDALLINDRGILSKPIQFFDKLQELFSGCSADGAFMEDPSSAADFDDEDDEDDKFDFLNDMSTYADTKVPQGEDFDKLESDSDDCKEVAALSAATIQVSSSTNYDLKPNKKNFKRCGKPKTLPQSHNDKCNKTKAKSTAQVHDSDDVDVLINNTLVGIKNTLEKPIQTVAPQDPNIPLWDMLKKIALDPDDKLRVGLHLCKPELQANRSFLISMGQEYLEHWIYKFLSGDDPNLG
ncbi:uncharacterized protein [Oryza sativa Japonica Group]|uniref:uncharacterized protein isoform X1 n=1 Tax=Oryza sativa subsp. japonica TaxID=39947 RepID=UPI000E1B69A3|nr:uncharacterized protein LOC4338066 isoform X1 [Oryza sativa Japonica Group]